MKTLLAASLIALILVGQPANAADAACPQHFHGSSAPEIANPKLAPKTRLLCFRAFAVLHSGLTRTPLWVAERLTHSGLQRAADTPREDSFHPEARLPADERAELADYARSGFDRGHLAPAADMPSKPAQAESFSLANMVPQDPQSNRGVWAGIEAVARDLARDGGEAFVVSGALFEGETLRRINERVFVPTRLWKAIYVPRTGLAGAYVVENGPVQEWREVSIKELSTIAGINPFPALQGSARTRVVDLPDPRLPGERRRGKTPQDGPEGILKGLIEQLTR
ncbi:DNA/RNA non-specific endonuclease [Arenibaculum pallidiluteum]|uniref:DNA/RNA non-specific endonuclease n=1 Tax=Arenibaculum pallidiluteum TaxID=2812559 RepID=UPI001A965B6A|nr:DNA/RNA non-specific endonuclease [Arenibaculum pallidiluteum]